MNINVNHEYDMLRGNVNRMCVCDTQEELERRKEFAIKNIENISVFFVQKSAKTHFVFSMQKNGINLYITTYTS